MPRRKKKGKKRRGKAKARRPATPLLDVEGNPTTPEELVKQFAANYKTFTEEDSIRVDPEIIAKARKCVEEKKLLKTVVIRSEPGKLASPLPPPLFLALTAYGHLAHLCLWRTPLFPSACTALAAWLQRDTRLLTLEIVDCSFGDAACTAVGSILQTNRGLRRLTLDYNEFGDAGAAQVAAGLALNTTLERLSLEGCALHAVGAGVIGGAAARSQLKSLSLKRNPLGADGLVELLFPLLDTSPLEELCLADCDIVEDEEAFTLLKEMATKSPLVRLDLRGNFFRDECGHPLVKMLEQKPQIATVGVSPFMAPALVKQLDTLMGKSGSAKKKKKGKKRKKKKKKKS
eukprot:gnl/Chilomastix_cuspidata/2866.p1 GENE.gnl/Chilomastix_cuspidata/2866~~gnl/Chilomastix_cuspidata/2866.p1  ORF type:complete len:353 (+),score=75.77 gnl/Chilomastix_cuspidata/2866:27-1061(+)